MISILDRCRAHAGPEAVAKAVRKDGHHLHEYAGHYLKYTNRY
jgi:hypothetical protein